MKNGIFPRVFLQKMSSQQSVNTKIIARFRVASEKKVEHTITPDSTYP
jgi:hypothetical protein